MNFTDVKHALWEVQCTDTYRAQYILTRWTFLCYHNTEWDGQYYPTTNLEKLTMLTSTTEYLFYLF